MNTENRSLTETVCRICHESGLLSENSKRQIEQVVLAMPAEELQSSLNQSI